MATKTDINYYIDYVSTMLGADFVDVEIMTVMEKIVKQSLEELKEYLTLNKLITIPYAQKINLKKYKVKHIIQVYRVQSADSIQGTSGVGDAFLLAMGMVQGIPYDLSRYTELLQIRKLKNAISVDLDWRFDDPYLYIHQNAMGCSEITIEYTPEVSKVEEITDDFWIGKLKKLVLANAKIILGRVRGKYKLSGSLYENDSATLLQEGNQEKKELLDFLSSNRDLVLPIGG